jgi:uncharacterized delta-60 repeat protein
MVYKKYVKKRGKLFGPYYYESYRDGNHVRKIYIGGEKEYQAWKKKKQKKKVLKKISKTFSWKKRKPGIRDFFGKRKKSVEQPKHRKPGIRDFFKTHKPARPFGKPPPGYQKNLRTRGQGFAKIYINVSLVVLIFLIAANFLIVGLQFYNLSQGFTGQAVQNVSEDLLYGEFNNETITQEFDYYNDLEIKTPLEFGGETISKNKNDRMDFFLKNGRIRLYFDLLNYSEFVESVGQTLPGQTTTQLGYGITGNVVDLESEEDIDMEEIREKIEEMESDEVQEIAEDSVLQAKEFNIKVDKASDKEYKWGYKVRLEDLHFMAKIDVTSDQDIVIYNDNSLKIGDNLLSFKDLKDAGYKIRIEKPSLEIQPETNITNITVIPLVNVTNITEVVNVTEIINVTNITDVVNVTNITEINITIPSNISEVNITNITEVVNVTEEVNITEVVNVTEEVNITIPENVTEPEEVNVSEEVEEPVEEVNETEKEEIKEEKQEEKAEEKEEKQVKEEEKQKEGKLKPEETAGVLGKEEEQTGYGSGVTGGVVRFIGLLGRVIGLEEEVRDEKYVNSITIYIERDFTDSGYEIGDIIELDPRLLILIDKADHLDSNRTFINDIYEYVKERDDNWSEIINNTHYVRVAFKSNLTRHNDITVFARMEGCVGNSSCSESGEIAVYRKNDDIEIARFMNITNENWYKILLTNMSENETRDVFDLKVISSIGAGIEFDYIVDPIERFFENCSDISDWTIDIAAGGGWVVASDQCEASGNENTNMTSGTIDLSGGDKKANLSFYWDVNGLDAADYFRVWVTNDSGTTWYKLFEVSSSSGSGTESFDLTDNITFTSSVQIRGQCIVGGGERCDWDNINITTFSLLNIVFPGNNSYDSNVSELNYTLMEDNPDDCWYSNNSGANNYSVQTAGTNFTGVVAKEGSNTWTVYCNNTGGEVFDDSITFYWEVRKIDLEMLSPNTSESYDAAQNQSFSVQTNVTCREYDCGTINLSLYYKDFNDPPLEEWVETYGTATEDWSTGIALDSSGNIYVGGLSNYDYHIKKYDSDGNEILNITFNKAIDYGRAIALDSSGNIYITGSADINNPTSGEWDYHTRKYDSSGNELWNATYDSGSTDDIPYGIDVDTSGNVYVTGGNGSLGDHDYYTIKYNSSGDHVWNRTYDSGNDDVAYDLVADSSNVYVTGGWDSSSYDYLTIKYDSSGNEQWNVTYDGGGIDVAYAIDVDSSGNVYVTGLSNLTNGSDYNYDYFTIKYNSSGDHVWNVTYDGGGHDRGYGIAVDSDGDVYVTGRSYLGSDDDYYTIKYNSSGDYQWNKSYDSGDNDRGYAVAVDSNKNVYVTGYNTSLEDWITIKYAPGGLVSTSAGTTPFYTLSSSNPLTTSSLDENESEVVTFSVNATGTVGNSFQLYTKAELIGNISITNTSEDLNVTIVAGSIPNITNVGAIPQKVINGTSLIVNATIQDNQDLDTAVAMLYYPNGTAWQNLTFSNTSDSYNASVTAQFNPAGRYNVTIYAKDVQGSVNNTEETYFIPYLNLSYENNIAIDGSFGDWNGTNVSDPQGDAGSGAADEELFTTAGDSNILMVYDYNGSDMLNIFNITTTGSVRRAEAGDIDGDGETEIVTGSDNGGNDMIQFWENNSGTWGNYYNRSFDCPIAIFLLEIDDVDGDDNLEVIGGCGDFISQGKGKVEILKNTSGSVTVEKTIDLSGMNNPWAGMEVGNLDNDNYKEIFIADESNSQFIVYEYNGSNYLNTVNFSYVGDMSVMDDMHVGDADGDGIDDLITCGSDDQLRLFNASGDNSYQTVWNSTDFDGGTGVQACGIGDFNGDGTPDLVGGDVNFQEKLEFYEKVNDQEGDYNFSNTWNYTYTGDGANIGCGVAFDMDADGRDEWGLGDDAAKYFNNDTSPYGPPFTVSTVTSLEPMALGAGDIDNDGGGGGGSSSFDIQEFALAHNSTHLFAMIEVNGTIDMTDSTQVYRIYFSNNESTGNSTSPEGTTIPISYDYYVQSFSGSLWLLYNASAVNTKNITTIANDSNNIEIAINFTDINITSDDNVNISFETASTNPESYDMVPDSSSFISYGESGGDTDPPLINITLPLNQSYGVNISTINYTYNDSNPGSCWYSNNSGKNNYSVQSAGTNFTNVISNYGSNTWTLYCNDSGGLENSTSVTFYKVACNDTDPLAPINCINQTITYLSDATLNVSANFTNCVITAENITIQSSGRVIYDNESLVVDKLTTDSGGYLEFTDSKNTIWHNEDWSISGTVVVNSSTHRMNITSNGEFGINVLAGGNLTVFNSSNITKGSQNFNYYFNVSGNFSIQDSYVEKTANNGIYLVSGSKTYEFSNVTFDGTGSSYSVTSEIDFNLTGDIKTAGNGIKLNQQNITLDCQGNIVKGTNDEIGVYTNQDNTTIQNCNVSMTSSASGIGVSVSSADKVKISNNTLSNQDYGIYLSNADYAIAINNTALGNTQREVYLEGASSHNIFQDSNFSTNGVYVYSEFPDEDGDSENNTFINCSYNISVEGVENGELIRKWHYRAYVNDSNGNNIGSADVRAQNRTSDQQFSITTNSSGWTNITSIADYINIGGTRTYYSNYTMQADNDSLIDIHTYNVTLEENNLNDVFTLETPGDITLDVLYPTDLSTTFNATQNQFFNVTLNISCYGGLCGIINISLDPENVIEAWTASYDGGDSESDTARSVALDASGNVYVFGSEDEISGGDGSFHARKYDSEGNFLLNFSSDGSEGYAIAVDNDGFIYTGGEKNNDYYLIKQNSSGGHVWNKTYDSCGAGCQDVLQDIAVDNSSNVYVTGYSAGGEKSEECYYTIKYNSGGTKIWDDLLCTNTTSEDSRAYGIVVDDFGNVTVTGSWNSSDYDYFTIRYNASGNETWNVSYDRGNKDVAEAIALDSSGNIYVTGQSYIGSDYDFFTVKYNSTGGQVWNVSHDSGNNDYAKGIAVDGSGNSYVTGYVLNGIYDDYYTIKYNSTGSAVWNISYDSGGTNDDRAYDIAVDSKGKIYVTGGSDEDYLTVAYVDKKALIPENTGSKPFYTNISNPYVTTLDSGEEEKIVFWVNATGDVDTTWIFFAYANLTFSPSRSNITSEWNVTIRDVAGPEVNITYPLNVTYNVNVSTINYTVNETSGYCWYSNDSGSNNYSVQTAGTNFTDVSSYEGSNTWTVYCNDSYGNEESDTVVFLKDTVNPLINFTDPTPANASSQVNTDIYVNYTVSDSEDMYSFIDFDESLRLWVRMDDRNSSGDPTDISGRGHNGTFFDINGTSNWTESGKFGDAWYFDGDADYVKIRRNSYLRPANLTLSAWIKAPLQGTLHTFIGYKYGGGTSYGFRIMDNNLSFQIRNTSGSGGGKEWAAQSTENFLDDNWHHILGTYNSSNITLYVDGEIKASNSIAVSPIAYVSTDDFFFGRMGPNHGFTLNGIIDEIMVFDRALSEEEITALYNATKTYHNFTDLEQGSYGITAHVVDIAGNRNSTETRNITVDTSAPTVVIDYPLNITYYVNVTELNYTVTDLDPDSCWYSNDSGATNSSSVTAGIDFTGLNASQGSNTWTLWCNDSSGYEGNYTVIFYQNVTVPSVTITYPENITYGINVSVINYTVTNVSGTVDDCWRSNDSGKNNYSLQGAGVNFTNVPSKEGSNIWTVYCNYSVGDGIPDNVTFYKDTVAPAISIVYPGNQSYNWNIDELNYTYTDSTTGYCWYSNDGGGTNSTTVSLGQNFTNVPSSPRSNNWTLWCNDSGGNENITSVMFFRNSIPEINITGTQDLNSTNTDINDYFVINFTNGTNLYETFKPIYIYGTMYFEGNLTGDDEFQAGNASLCENEGTSSGWTTVFITQPVTLNGGNLTIEPGVVIKFNNSGYIIVKNNSKIISSGVVNTTARCWIIYTSFNDNNTGANVTGSSGSPDAGDYSSAIILENTSSNASEIEFNRFKFASMGLNISINRLNSSETDYFGTGYGTGAAWTGYGLSHNQFYNNTIGVSLSDSLNVSNNLFSAIVDYGIKIATAVSSNLYINYNTFDSNSSDAAGIYVDNSGDVYISDNVFSNMENGILNKSKIINDYNAYYNNTRNTANASEGSNIQNLTFSPYERRDYFYVDNAGTIDAAKNDSSAVGMDSYYTQSSADTGVADIGYHYSYPAINKQIGIAVLYPNTTRTYNATLYQLFNVTINITCLRGYCGTINVSLDPNNEIQNGDFETGDLTNWSTGGDASWTAQSTEVYQGSYAGASGDVGDSQSSWINQNVSLDRNSNITFYWKVSSEEDFDKLCFCIDNSCGSAGCTCSGGGTSNASISGEVNWTNVTYGVPGGNRSLYWCYVKDGSVSEGSDMGWLDSVSVVLGGKGLVSTTPGATPFFTNASSNPLTTSNSLDENESETVIFWVNSTGGFFFLWEFFAYTNLTMNLSVGNMSSIFNVSILEPINPIISITYPENTTYGENVSTINYTFIDSSSDSCWYSNDSGKNNYSVQPAKTNFTNVPSYEGSNSWIIWCNDSLGNEGNDSVVFFKNTTLDVTQVITINESGDVGGIVRRGENVTFNATVINATVIDSVWVVVWDTILGSSIVWQGFLNFISGNLWSITTETDWTWNLGMVNYTIYANDTIGQEANMSGNFTLTEGSDVNSCGNLSQANSVYTLVKNVNSTGTCFNITAANITLDCNNYEINYSYGGTLGYGIVSNQINTTIRECVVREGTTSTNNKHAVTLSGNNATVKYNEMYTIGTGSRGINLASDYGLIDDNNISTSGSSGYGVVLNSTDNGEIYNNNITTSNTNAYGIYFLTSVSNSFVNNTVTTSGNTAYGFAIEDDCYNTYGENFNIRTTSATNAYGIYVQTDKTNTTIIDSVVNATNSNDIYIGNDQDAGSFLDFLNVTFNRSDTSINNKSFELEVKWYYSAYVNDSNGNDVGGANITAYNTSGDNAFFISTNSSGWTNITNITEFTDNGTRYSYSNYTLNATKSGYYNDTHMLNITITTNKLDDVFTLNTPITINSITITPSVAGLGQLINITANVTAGADISSVWVGITAPGQSQSNYTMSNSTPEIFNYTSYRGWYNGSYSVTVYANDTDDNVESSSDSFNVYNDNITVQIRTLQDSYRNSTIINLTDPPGGNIEITKAEHLDENKNYIRDIYDRVGKKDDEWYNVSDEEYVRVTFEESLDEDNDVKVFARGYEESNEIEIYKEDGDEKIAEILEIKKEAWYRTLLTGMVGKAMTLDLKVRGIIGFDYITDPPANDSSTLYRCGTLDSPGTYTMNQSITNNTLTGDCIDVNAQNVTIDCAGYFISSDDAYSGVYTDQFNTTVKNCNISMGTGAGGFGVELTEASDNSNIINNTLDNQRIGIHTSGADYLVITNTTTSGNSLYGINMGLTSNDVNMTNIIANNNNGASAMGINVYGVSDCRMINITANYNNLYGINNQQCQGLIITNATASHGVAGNSAGIRFWSTTTNSVVTNAIVTNSTYGIVFATAASGSNFRNITANNNTYGIFGSNNIDSHTFTNLTALYNSYGVYISMGSDNNEFKNCNLSNSVTNDVFLGSGGGVCTNNQFINCSYDASTESVGAGSEIIRKWYYQAYVNDTSGNAVSGVNVTGYNVTVAQEFKVLTNSSGWINKTEVTEYLNVGGAKTYYNNYTINTTNGIASDEHSYNLTIEENILNDVFTLSCISYSEFEGKGDTTDLCDYDLTSNADISNLILHDPAYGKIRFLENVTINNSMDIDSVVDITYNNASVDASAYNQAFNKSAEITLYGLTLYGYPKVLREVFECDPPTCNIVSWDPSIGQAVFNVTSFSGYQASEANQSKVQNNGTYNISFYLLMKTQSWDSGWSDEDIIINDSDSSTLRTVEVNNLTKLDEIWNPKNYNSSNLTYGKSMYRVYVALQDPDGNILQDSQGNNLVASFNFTIDDAIPYQIELNAPANNSYLVSGDVSFNWTAYDDVDGNLTCNLTIDSTVEAMNVRSQNATMVNYTVSGLSLGDHFWNVTCWDDAMNTNISLTYNVSLYSSNQAPSDPTVTINSTDGTNRTLQDLNCFATISDPNDDKLNVTIRWYVDGSLNLTVDYNNSYDSTGGYFFNAVLDSGNTSKGENWNCSMRLYDGNLYGNWTNSSNLTILNTPPNVTLVLPDDDNITTDRTPNFNWTGSDDDGDTMQYEMNISLVGGSTCVDSDRWILNTTILSNENYTLTSYLKCFLDNQDSYNWTVRAWDDETNGSWALMRNFSIQSNVTITLNVSNIVFSSSIPGDTDNTTDGSPGPFILLNNGNSLINVTVNFTALWNSTTHPNETYQYKVRNTTAGCFVISGSQTSWASSPAAASLAINEFNFTAGYQTGCSNTSVDIYLEVPGGEPGGDKSSLATFTGLFAEVY